jgi:hypothetical protein
MSLRSPTEHEKGKAVHPISFFPRSRGKMKKGDRKGSSDFDGSTDRIFERGHEGLPHVNFVFVLIATFG